jgi:hypothetical protein
VQFVKRHCRRADVIALNADRFFKDVIQYPDATWRSPSWASMAGVCETKREAIRKDFYSIERYEDFLARFGERVHGIEVVIPMRS